jgi:isomerase DpgB
LSSTPALSELGEGADFFCAIDTAQPLSQQLIIDLNQLADQVEDATDDSILVLHLGDRDTGDSDAGSAGSWPGEVGIHIVNRWERVLRRLERLSAVTVAVAQGPCGGPALEVLLASDYRLGTKDMRLDLPAMDGEFWPGMAVHRLANQLGVARARRMVLFGNGLTAHEAMQAGLIDEIVDDVVEGVNATQELAGRVTGSELGVRRRLLLEATTTSFEEALGTHLAACDRTLRRGQRAEDPTAVTP